MISINFARTEYVVFGHIVDGMEVVLTIHHTPVDIDKDEGWVAGDEPVVIAVARVEVAD